MELAFVMSDGKLFQIHGPTNVNHDSWTCVRLFFVVRRLFTVLDCNTLVFLHLTTTSIRYPGAVPSTHLYMRMAILNITLYSTLSQ